MGRSTHHTCRTCFLQTVRLGEKSNSRLPVSKLSKFSRYRAQIQVWNSLSHCNHIPSRPALFPWVSPIGPSSGKKYNHALTSESSLEFGVGAEKLYNDDMLSVSLGEAVTKETKGGLGKTGFVNCPRQSCCSSTGVEHQEVASMLR